jgi:hypothetical protein
MSYLKDSAVWKEFFRLKWQETKSPLIIVVVLYLYYSIIGMKIGESFCAHNFPSLHGYNGCAHFIWATMWLLIFMFVPMVGFLLIRGIQVWLKDNWKQAIKNTYPKKKRKKK